MLRNAHTHTRISSISNHRLNIRSIKMNFFIKNRIIFTLQSFPILDCLIPFFSLRCILTAFDIFESHFIRCNHTSTGPHLNRKVTERQPTFHCKATDRFTRIFYKISGRTTRCHFRHHIESDVFGCYSLAQLTIHRDAHGLGT